MTDYTELQKAAAYAAQDTTKFADESEEMRALQQFHEEVDPETVLALIAENAALRKDSERYRWLRDNDSEYDWEFFGRPDDGLGNDHDLCDEEIDAAMGVEGAQ